MDSLNLKVQILQKLSFIVSICVYLLVLLRSKWVDSRSRHQTHTGEFKYTTLGLRSSTTIILHRRPLTNLVVPDHLS